MKYSQENFNEVLECFVDYLARYKSFMGVEQYHDYVLEELDHTPPWKYEEDETYAREVGRDLDDAQMDLEIAKAKLISTIIN